MGKYLEGDRGFEALGFVFQDGADSISDIVSGSAKGWDLSIVLLSWPFLKIQLNPREEDSEAHLGPRSFLHM